MRAQFGNLGTKHHILDVLLIALLLRISLIPFFYDVYNYWSSRVFSSFLLGGFNPWYIAYVEPALARISPWGYPPLYILFVLLAQLVSAGNDFAFIYAIKMPLILSDIITGFLLFKIARARYGVGIGKRVAILFLFNPLSIIVSSVWGINDSIPIMFTVLSLFFFLNRKNVWSSAFFLGLGAAFKLYPLFILPAFLAKIRRFREILIFTTISLMPLLISSLPFILWDSDSYLGTLLFFSTGKSISTISFIPKGSIWSAFQIILEQLMNERFPMAILSNLSSIILFSSMIIIFFFLRRKNIDLFLGITLYLLILYSFSFRMMGNYYSWIIPFACLVYYHESQRGSNYVERAKILRILPNIKRALVSNRARLLLLLFIPVLADVLLFNGLYTEFEGATGILYWTLHWLGLKIRVYQLVPYYSAIRSLPSAYYNTRAFFSLSIFLICFYYTLKIIRSSSVWSKDGRVEGRGSFLWPHRKYLTVAFRIKSRGLIILTMILAIFSASFLILQSNSTFNHVDFESYDARIMIDPESSEFSFSDNFSSCLLNPQWCYFGNGIYSMHPEDAYSHITIDTCDAGRSSYISRNFSLASTGRMEFIFSFIRLYPNAIGLSIADLDYGRLILMRDRFKYIDYEGDTMTDLGVADSSWHNLRMDFCPTNYTIYFDDRIIRAFDAHQSFSYLQLGNSEIHNMFGGVSRFSYVNVFTEEFPIGSYSLTLAYSSLIFPLIIIFAVGLIINYKKL